MFLSDALSPHPITARCVRDRYSQASDHRELYARLKTEPSMFCRSVLRRVPVAASQKCTVPCLPPLASVRPSGLYARLWTAPMCPVKVFFSVSVCVSHKRIVRSKLPLASVRPSGAIRQTGDRVGVFPEQCEFSSGLCVIHPNTELRCHCEPTPIGGIRNLLYATFTEPSNRTVRQPPL